MLRLESSRIDSRLSEAYILGAVMQDGTVMDDLMDTIRTEMFTDRVHADLWQRMCALKSKGDPVDIASVALAAADIIARVEPDYLFNMQEMYIGRADLQWHVQKVVEAHIRRKLLQRIAQLQQMAADVTGVTLDELRSYLEETTLDVSQTTPGFDSRTSLEATLAWVEALERKFRDPKSAYGMTTGWRQLDEWTTGWQRQDLIVVGGRTSVGKTAFATENIIRMVKQGYRVMVFSLEMSADQIRNRIASNLTGIPLSKLRTGQFDNAEQMVQVSNTIDLIGQVVIDDRRGVSADHIAAEMKRVKRAQGLDFVVVDYLQEVVEPPQPNDNTGSAYGRVARKLRKAAKDCDCAVMALSQLSRQAEGKKPTLAELSGSSGIESAADLVILLHRDREEDPNVIHVHLAKHRNGPTGEMRLYYNTDLQQMRQLYEGGGMA